MPAAAVIPAPIVYIKVITLNKIRCLKQNIMLMNIQAWDNAEEMSIRHFERRIKRNNWGDSENNGRGENP